MMGGAFVAAEPAKASQSSGVRSTRPTDAVEQQADRWASLALTAPPKLLRDAPHLPPAVPGGAEAAGEPIPPDVRASLEPAFWFDFSRVRIHADDAAARSAERVNAHAFTTRGDIFFARGMYQPRTAAGYELLAHELAHVTQQTVHPSLEPAIFRRACGPGWDGQETNYGGSPGLGTIPFVQAHSSILSAPIDRLVRQRGLATTAPFNTGGTWDATANHVSSSGDQHEVAANRFADAVASDAPTPLLPETGSREIDPATRAFYTPRLGVSLDGVRIHAGATVAALARDLDARALTLDRDIGLGAETRLAGPESRRHLIAHEIAHVAQQRRGVSAGVIQRQAGHVSQAPSRPTVDTQRPFDPIPLVPVEHATIPTEQNNRRVQAWIDWALSRTHGQSHLGRLDEALLTLMIAREHACNDHFLAAAEHYFVTRNLTALSFSRGTAWGLRGISESLVNYSTGAMGLLFMVGPSIALYHVLSANTDPSAGRVGECPRTRRTPLALFWEVRGSADGIRDGGSR
jgi:hypothetical protein